MQFNAQGASAGAGDGKSKRKAKSFTILNQPPPDNGPIVVCDDCQQRSVDYERALLPDNQVARGKHFELIVYHKLYLL